MSLSLFRSTRRAAGTAVGVDVTMGSSAAGWLQRQAEQLTVAGVCPRRPSAFWRV